MEKKFNEQDSLRVINEMIAQAKNNFSRGGLSIVIFWGYLVAATAIGNYILLQILDNRANSYHIWWVMVIGGVISYFMQRKIDRTTIVKTHIDRIINFIWWGFGISAVMLQIVFRVMVTPDNWQFIYVTPIILMMCGMGQFITAKAYRYKPYYWGAILFWLGALSCSIITSLAQIIDYQFIILAVCMIGSFVIPNHILNNKMKKHV